MTPSASPQNTPARAWRWLWLAPVLAAAVAAVYFFRPGTPQERPALFTVRRGPLTISVTERGTIENREKEIVKNRVEGRTTVVWLIEEGTVVKEGDLLMELDASQFKEDRIEQEIKVQNSEAALIQAQESLAITRNQAEADIEEAERNVRFAKLDLTKYTEGDYPVSLQQAESEITLAGEELRNAEDRYTWSTNLAARGYITQMELLSDELAVKRKRIDLETAIKNRDVLVAYQHERDLEELTSLVKQAKMALERMHRKTRADIIKAESDLRARESEHERQKSKLDNIVTQIEACRITAPAAGMVVYASSGQSRRYRRMEPLTVGSEVSERQELFHLPTSEQMNADVRVQESSLRKVALGQPVRITVDAVPGRVYAGTLTHIPVLPDATRAWLNPDLKIYACEVQLRDGSEDLRPGMSCRAEIIVKELPDAVFVPVQCVLRVGHQPTAYVYADGQTVARPVTIGMDNGRMVHVIDGLTAGEQVLLAPPLAHAVAPSALPSPEPEETPAAQQDAAPAQPRDNASQPAAPAEGKRRGKPEPTPSPTAPSA